MRTHVYIIEDHPIMQEMLQEFLRRLPDLEVCGIAATGQAALEQLPTIGADLVLVDVSLPDMSGIDLLGELQLACPHLPCLMLSSHQEIIYVQRALAAGAKGYVAKGKPLELVDAIQQVRAGGSYVSESIRTKLGEAGGRKA